jgi:hypothetical protein
VQELKCGMHKRLFALQNQQQDVEEHLAGSAQAQRKLAARGQSINFMQNPRRIFKSDLQILFYSRTVSVWGLRGKRAARVCLHLKRSKVIVSARQESRDEEPSLEALEFAGRVETT